MTNIKGAGRKKIIQNPVRLCFDFERDDYLQIQRVVNEANQKGVSPAKSVSSVIRDFVRRGLMRYSNGRILTLEEAQLISYPWFVPYGDKVYKYNKSANQKGYFALIINGEDVLEGKGAVYCDYLGNGIYKWKDEQGEWHNGKCDMI
jgi:hypothetical protein